MNRTVTTSTPLNGVSARFPSASPSIIVNLSEPFPPAGMPRLAVAQKFSGTNTAQADAPEAFKPIIMPRRVRSSLHPEKRAAVRALFLTALVISFTTVLIVMQKQGAVTSRPNGAKESILKGLTQQMEKLWYKPKPGKTVWPD